MKEYASEVRLYIRVLVKLMVGDTKKKKLLLIYKFKPKGSLDSNNFMDNMFLTWIMRYDIARG